ncbi:YciI family protein [Shimia abyssi]|uniref:YCII-related domain-containing protein n=1 Tax=Shimia abyssi TaxID=1662395 RepID=A0A2P8FB51_9RHOB|nr:YciI family protein [Shimia abyssi]PSL18951.1 hypothetical protein CLV88_108130 [Shimia abyssi]
MKFIVLFEDAASAPGDVRQRYMQAHLAFLERHVGVIEAAGPVADVEHKGRDGVWIVDAESVAAVEKLVHEDPFWETGLRASVSILAWRQVYAGGERLI